MTQKQQTQQEIEVLKGGRRGEDDEEFEMLLGEIPQVTSAPPPSTHADKGNKNSDENQQKNSLDFFMVSPKTNLHYNGGSGSPLEGKNSTPSPRILSKRSPSTLIEDQNNNSPAPSPNGVVSSVYSPNANGGASNVYASGPNSNGISSNVYASGPNSNGVASNVYASGPNSNGVSSNVYASGPNSNGVASNVYASGPNSNGVSSNVYASGPNPNGVSSNVYASGHNLTGVASNVYASGPNSNGAGSNMYAELINGGSLLENPSLAVALGNLCISQNNGNETGGTEVVQNGDVGVNNYHVNDNSLNPAMNYGTLPDDLSSLTESQAMRKYLKQRGGDVYSEIGMVNPNAMQYHQQQQQQSYLLPNSGFVHNSNREASFRQHNYVDRVNSGMYLQPRSISDPQRMQLTWQQMEEEKILKMQQEYLLLQQTHHHGNPFTAIGNQLAPQIVGDSSSRILGHPALYSSMPNLLHHNSSFGNPALQVQGASYIDKNWGTQNALAGLVGAHNQVEHPVTNGNLCRYFAQGYCSRGQGCPFYHGQLQQVHNGRTSAPSLQYKDPLISPLSSYEQKSFPEKILTRNKNRAGSCLTTINPAPLVSRKEVQGNGHSSLKAASSNEHPLSGTFHLDRGMSPDSTDPFRALGINNQQQNKFTSLEEIAGKIYLVAKDQHGCRFLQKKFDEGSVEDVKKIFAEIIEHIIELMTDPFGNYLVQKLLEVCNEEQRMDILQEVTKIPDELVNISLNMHGTRAVQKLIEILKTPREVSLAISSLKSGVVTLIKDLNGNHVVQRCLQRLSSEDNKFLFDAAVDHCIEIATHRHGCCVLQRCIDHAVGPQKQRLVATIASNAFELSQDAFGNYVVQYILDLDIKWATTNVMNQMEGKFVALSMQKFSSNVVEKCLKVSTEDGRAQVVRELISFPRLGQLLQDQYANYVFQRALQVCKGSVHSALVEAIRPHLPSLRNSPFGKRILRTNLKK